MRMSIIGSGNVSKHLATEFLKSGHKVVEIISRNRKTGLSLANDVQANYLSSLSECSENIDLFFICVPDNSIEKVSELLPKNIPHIHCSGITDLNVLKSVKKAVFYPLQTFSKDKEINFEEISFYLESNNQKTLNSLKELVTSLKANYKLIDTQERQRIHLSAVFVSNFTNAMFAVSENILKDTSLSKEILFPLIDETVEKFKQYPAKDAQTGPAKRKDKNTLEIHQEILKNYTQKELEVYSKITKLIEQQQNEEL